VKLGALTTDDGRTDIISDLEIDFEVRSELHDFPCEVASDVRTLRREEPVT
jgi:hypothetical protein